jgi:tetratricopeptide (TPR) repeat protein
LISRNWQKGVYVDLPQKAPNGYDARPVGLPYRLRPAEAGPDKIAELDAAEDRLEFARHRRGNQGQDFFSLHERTYEASALTNLGARFASLGQTARAERLYERSLALGVEPAPAWNNWANLAFDKSDYRLAVVRYKLALKAEDRPQFHYNLGRAEYAAGQIDEAKREYESVLAKGSYPPAANDLALIWMQSGEVQRALDAFQRLAEQGYSPAKYNLGMALEKAGRKPEAAVAFQDYFPNAAEADRPALREKIKQLLR